MKRQTSKALGLRQAEFELKRMELLRYHNDLLTDTGNGISSIWLMILLATLFTPTTFVKKESEPDKEE